MVSASTNRIHSNAAMVPSGSVEAAPLSVTFSPGSPSVSERVWSGPAFAVGSAGALTVITTSSSSEPDSTSPESSCHFHRDRVRARSEIDDRRRTGTRPGDRRSARAIEPCVGELVVRIGVGRPEASSVTFSPAWPSVSLRVWSGPALATGESFGSSHASRCWAFSKSSVGPGASSYRHDRGPTLPQPVRHRGELNV